MLIRCRCGKTIPLPIGLIGKRVNCPQCRGPMFPIGTGKLGSKNDFAYRLFIARGPNHVGVQIPLCGDGPISIGRIAGVQILLTGDRVSRKHCILNPHFDGWKVTDLKSSNGSFLNGKKITDPIDLIAGDLLSIGKYEMVYEVMRLPADQPAVLAAREPLLDQAPPLIEGANEGADTGIIELTSDDEIKEE